MAQGAKSMASNLFLVNSVSWCVIKDDGVWIYTLPGPFSLFKLHTSLPACELDWVILHQNADVRVVYWRSYSSIDSIEQIPHHRSVGRQDIPSLPFPSLPKRNEAKRTFGFIHISPLGAAAQMIPHSSYHWCVTISPMFLSAS